MSWPVFMEPPPQFEVGPHPKLVSDENPPKFMTKKFCDYAYCKLNKIPQQIYQPTKQILEIYVIYFRDKYDIDL